VATERRWEGLGRAQKGRHARPHLAEGVEDAVENDEEGEDGLNGPEGAANDESHDGPAEEAKGHGLLSTDAVHQDTADDAARQVEAVDDSLDEDVRNLEDVKGRREWNVLRSRCSGRQCCWGR
jgi:hypothetical protein